jgi:hypothetical protein
MTAADQSWIQAVASFHSFTSCSDGSRPIQNQSGSCQACSRCPQSLAWKPSNFRQTRRMAGACPVESCRIIFGIRNCCPIQSRSVTPGRPTLELQITIAIDRQEHRITRAPNPVGTRSGAPSAEPGKGPSLTRCGNARCQGDLRGSCHGGNIGEKSPLDRE